MSIEAPNVLIPVEVFRVYADDPAELGRILAKSFLIADGEKVKVDKPADRIVTNKVVESIRYGLESYNKRAEHARVAANARWKREPKRVEIQKPSEKLDWESQLREFPLFTMLQLVDEEQNERTSGVFSSYIKRKDFDLLLEEVRAFKSELNQGEMPRNRGAALTARLKNLPDKGTVCREVKQPVKIVEVPIEITDEPEDSIKQMRAAAYAKLGISDTPDFTAG